MEPLANVNGVQMPLADVKISVLDRGFLFGDAIYDVIRVYQGKPWLLDEHFRRIANSLESIRIHGVDLARVRQRMLDTIKAGGFKESTIYLQITRGAAPRAHTFPENTTPFELIWVREFVDPYKEARQKGGSVITQPDIRWERCDIKSTNLLANVLACQAAKEAGGVEALFYLADGTLTEGTHTSFFGVLDGAILTAPNSPSILPGITRGLVVRLAARAGIPLKEHVLKKSDLPRVTELFLTGTTSEVLPITRVDNQTIGSGQPGAVTRRLQQAYDEAVREFLAG